MSGGDILVSLIAAAAALFLAFRGVQATPWTPRGRMVAIAVWVVLIGGLALVLS